MEGGGEEGRRVEGEGGGEEGGGERGRGGGEEGGGVTGGMTGGGESACAQWSSFVAYTH